MVAATVAVVFAVAAVMAELDVHTEVVAHIVAQAVRAGGPVVLAHTAHAEQPAVALAVVARSG